MIIAIKDFKLGDKYYFINDEIKGLNFETIVRLNELGFIKPLSTKELVKLKEKEDKNGTTL